MKGRRLVELAAQANRVMAERHITQDDNERARLALELSALNTQRVKTVMEVVACMGDFLVAMHNARLAQFSEGVLGASGLTSALIGGYYKWKTLNSK